MSDSEFLALFTAMLATISADLASYPGITAAMLTAAGARRDDYSDKLLAHNQAQDAARAATVAKDGARDLGEDDVRKFRDLLKANGVAEDKYAAIGIPTPSILAPANATVPAATVDTSERLRHTISFADAAAGGNKRRPRGLTGVEIWVKIDGAPPGSEKDCTFLGLVSKTPFVVNYAAEDAGKMAHYMLRWQFKDGAKSAFGETVSATVTG